MTFAPKTATLAHRVACRGELTLVHVVSRSGPVETAAPSEGEGPTQPEVIKPERREKDE